MKGGFSSFFIGAGLGLLGYWSGGWLGWFIGMVTAMGIVSFSHSLYKESFVNQRKGENK